MSIASFHTSTRNVFSVTSKDDFMSMEGPGRDVSSVMRSLHCYQALVNNLTVLIPSELSLIWHAVTLIKCKVLGLM